MLLGSSLATLLAAGSLVVASALHKPYGRTHHDVAERSHARDNNGTHTMQKRFSGHATWFKVGLGACGKHSNPGDFIVALDTPQYGGGYPGPNCFRTLTISGQGKTATATVMDECPTCPYGSLDMSSGLFQHFADLGLGEFPITWTWGDSGGGNNNNDNSATHHTTTTHHTTHTTTETPRTTSTEDAKTTTTTTSSSSDDNSSSSTSTTSAPASSQSSSGDDGGDNGGDGDCINNQQAYVANLGNLITVVMGN